jgi:DNA repair protein SbcC/Rad50
MIPLQLTLRHFLSYREATLDFQGLHTACICGANGAGKSSLLEAISWGIWGESRVANEDDVIHQGESEARVDYSFRMHDNTYRVIRTRYRGQGMTLDFQVATADGKFRPLTAKTLRMTQQLIIEQINLDYETFINSAYLRQGRADEFMLKRPGERKQILADLLKLQHYDELADRARDQSRQIKGQLESLERQLQQIAEQLQQRQIDRERATATDANSRAATARDPTGPAATATIMAAATAMATAGLPTVAAGLPAFAAGTRPSGATISQFDRIICPGSRDFCRL